MFDQFLSMLSGHLTSEAVIAFSLLWGTVIVAAVLTYFRSSRTLRQHLLPSGIITHPSARTDVCFWIARRLTKFLYLLPASAAVTVLTGSAFHAGLTTIFGHHTPGPADTLTLVVF